MLKRAPTTRDERAARQLGHHITSGVAKVAVTSDRRSSSIKACMVEFMEEEVGRERVYNNPELSQRLRRVVVARSFVLNESGGRQTKS